MRTEMQEPEKIDPKTFHPNTASNEQLGEHVDEEASTKAVITLVKARGKKNDLRRCNNQQTESTEKDHVGVNTQLGYELAVIDECPCPGPASDLTGKISILCDGKVPCSCTADDCIGNDSNGLGGIM